MHIAQTRIRSVSRHFGSVVPGTVLTVALTEPQAHVGRLTEIGFDGLNPGTRVLPAIVGPVSRRNAEGDEVVHRDQPKETAYRQREWRWKEWHGPYDRVEKSDIVDVPYKRYPRTRIPPQSAELTVIERDDGSHLVVSDSVTFDPDDADELVHLVNLFLELFGECTVLNDDLEELHQAPTRRLNWRVLPEGELPWERLQEEVGDVVRGAAEGNQPVIWDRLATVGSYGPDFTAVGQGGFHGYVIFGFRELGIFVLESAYYGNATYVLGSDWERLSRMTKAELLDEDLHEDRIVHRDGWKGHVRSLLDS